MRCRPYACFSEALGTSGVLALSDSSRGDVRLASVRVDAPVIDSVGVDERADDEEAWEASVIE